VLAMERVLCSRPVVSNCRSACPKCVVIVRAERLVLARLRDTLALRSSSDMAIRHQVLGARTPSVSPEATIIRASMVWLR
jgi:hypothetical protein